MESRRKALGKRLLKASGVLMIILGAAMLGLLGAGLGTGFTGQIDKRIVFSMCGLGSVGILQLTAGMVGVKNCGRAEKAAICLVWGIIAVVFSWIGIVLGFAIEQSRNTFVENRNIYALLFVLPVLYLIGAVLNRKSALSAHK